MNVAPETVRTTIVILTLAGVFALGSSSCDDGGKSFRECSSVCDEMEKGAREYCTEADPKPCLKELQEATERCKKRCEKDTK